MAEAAAKTGILDRFGRALDRLVAVYNPVSAVARQESRNVFNYYDAAKKSTKRKFRREQGNGDAKIGRAGAALRNHARYLEDNHDLARNALNILVARAIGADGVSIIPMPRDNKGDIIREFATDLTEWFREWSLRPEVTWQHDWAGVQRLGGRAWLRDGEMLAQLLRGYVPYLDHGTSVPLSLELIESDQLPFEYNDQAKRIIQGVEKNAWGRHIAYHLFKEHPAGPLSPLQQSTKRVDADRILHPKLVDRFGQTRGASIFASVIDRLEDVKDYEESERIAAKLAARMAGYVRKGDPTLYKPTDKDEGDAKRMINWEAGTIFDGLGMGEEIGMIDSKRPNPNLVDWRRGQLMAVSGGLQVSYSSLAKDYNGTYSAQRQEMVEQYEQYNILTAGFVAQMVRPVWQQFVSMAVLSGKVSLPAGLDVRTLDDAMFLGPAMPWIDPYKEIQAAILAVQGGIKSLSGVIYERKGDPTKVFKQLKQDKDSMQDTGIDYSSINLPGAGSTNQEGATN